jgi:hypothetical protein
MISTAQMDFTAMFLAWRRYLPIPECALSRLEIAACCCSSNAALRLNR